MSSKLVLLLVSSVLLPVAALAHPGHGAAGEGWTLLHYLSEPVHIAATAGLTLAAVAGLRLLRRRRNTFRTHRP